MVIQQEMPLDEKLRILSDAAKYDVACTSSGVDRRAEKGAIGNTSACGICHSFAADGRCISLLKILMTNECIYNCRYCINRCSNDVVRATFTPEEICTLTMEFYKRNYIEGLFLSSGVIVSPDYTMEQLYRTLYLLRHVYRFNGYIHVKGIPGTDPVLIEEIGFLADRMSINLELPTSEGLRQLAPNKTRKTILTPMRQIQRGIGKRFGGFLTDGQYGYDSRTFFRESSLYQCEASSDDMLPNVSPEGDTLIPGDTPYTSPATRGYTVNGKPSVFVPAGQSTQMIIGATNESDYQLVSVAQALYHNFGLKRVFYSAFININEDSSLPDTSSGPELLREHRLYQADWLMRFYGFQAEELLSEARPNFNPQFDPKCDWALQHLEHFPVEINRASYQTLLRVPGIGVKSARRILQARRQGALDFDGLKRLGVVLKRAHYFITCNGRQMYHTPIEEHFISSQLSSAEQQKNWEIAHQQQEYRQMSLFEDYGVTRADRYAAVTGQM